MKAINLVIMVVVLAAILALGLFFLRNSQPTAPVQPAQETKPVVATVEARVGLPKVLTLYQPEDGESDLAVFVSNELNKEARGVATFRLINVEAEPQLAELYGVSDTPAVVFLTSTGKLFRKHDGYLDKKEILSIVAQIKN
jgi:hypothetical protein